MAVSRRGFSSGVAAAKPLKIARSFFGKWWRAELRGNVSFSEARSQRHTCPRNAGVSRREVKHLLAETEFGAYFPRSTL